MILLIVIHFSNYIKVDYYRPTSKRPFQMAFYLWVGSSLGLYIGSSDVTDFYLQ